jgi:hypothetical protein
MTAAELGSSAAVAGTGAFQIEVDEKKVARGPAGGAPGGVEPGVGAGPEVGVGLVVGPVAPRGVPAWRWRRRRLALHVGRVLT